MAWMPSVIVQMHGSRYTALVPLAQPEYSGIILVQMIEPAVVHVPSKDASPYLHNDLAD